MEYHPVVAGSPLLVEELFTVTVTVVDVVWLPAASRATAVRVCVLFATPVVFHDTEYGTDVSSLPMLVPSTLNCTPATPTLSDAVAATLTVPDTVELFAGEVIETVGPEVSAGAEANVTKVPFAEVA